ncbi:MAG: aldehyde ferredoxin oxidoreductase family protein [Methanosarcinales archaeon]
MSHIWKSKIAYIDLTEKEVLEEYIDKQTLKEYVGGRGLGVKFLFDSLTPRIDPLSPDNILIVCVGPLTGIAPLSGRHAIVTKSPLTNTIFDSSAGGFFGAELKRTGYDVLFIIGKSEEPCNIFLENENIEFKSAKALWGLNTKETTSKLKKYGRVMCIGRAGERLIKYANIMNDYYHCAGRGGVGAVMGSKNLKAVVVKGNKKAEIADYDAYLKAEYEMTRLLKASPVLSKGLSNYGTASLVALINYMNIMPTKNFQYSYFEEAEKISGEAIKENYSITKKPCYKCFIGCKRISDKEEVPEYETIWTFGANLENSDLESLFKANSLCNDYGIDTISCGGTIATYAEKKQLFEDLKKDNLLATLIKLIGEKKEIGSELAYGSYAYDAKLSMSVKGLELPGYDPRGCIGQALSYATSNRGGCHLRAYMVGPEIIGKPKLIDRLSFNGKAGLVTIFQNLAACIDSLIFCKFTSFVLSEEEYANLLSPVVGIDYTSEDLLTVGERIWNLERLFNIREGFSRFEDTLPDRVFDKINKEEFEKMLSQYYHFRGWKEDGIPTKEKLLELNIKVE